MSYVGIKYKPLPLLKQFHEEREQYFIRAIVTGYGGGKTYGGVMELLQVSGINRGVPNIYIEPTYQMIKDILQPLFIQVLDDNCIPYDLNKSEHNFTFPLWDGHIWLRSGDKPQKLKGITAGMVGIDEPFIQEEEIYKIAVSRARHPEAKVKGVFLTGTPEQLNWGYELLESGRRDVKKYQGTSYDNIVHLGQDYVDNMLNHYSEKEIEAYVEGKFINLTTGQAYYAFSDENIFDYEFEYMNYRPLEISCDFNVGLQSWTIGQEKQGNDYEFDYIEMEDFANTEKMCLDLKDRYKHHQGTFVFYGDIAGSQRSPETSQTNWSIIQREFPNAIIHYQSIKNIKDRVDAMNGRLCNSRNERRVFIHKKLTRLIKDCRQVTWEMLLNKNKAGKLTHASDGVSYKYYWKYPLVTQHRVRVYE